jgi:hypothetical protein
MKQSLFEHQHQHDWQAFATLLDALERGKADSPQCKGFAAAYRNLCQHLALAQSRGYSSHLIEQLQQLAMRGHQQFYRHRSPLGANYSVLSWLGSRVWSEQSGASSPLPACCSSAAYC